MKKFLLFLYVTMNLSSFSQSDMENDLALEKEIKWYIDTINKRGNEYTNQFVVYVLHAYKADKGQNGTCFTLGYIMNSYDYRYILPRYFFTLDNEYILVRLSDGLNADCLTGINLQELNKNNQVKIVQKLYPSALGDFTYHPPGITFCWDGENSNRTFYENADEIPMEKSIWGDFPQGGQMDLIREK